MKRIEIFDPAMCCPTGLCGPNINPDLMRIAAVLETLKRQGIISSRYARRCIVFSSGRVSRQVNILCFCVCETKNSEIPCAPLGKRRNSK